MFWLGAGVSLLGVTFSVCVLVELWKSRYLRLESSGPTTVEQKPLAAADPRASWTEPAQYANALIDLVGQPVQWESTGLEKNKVHVRLLGEEINQKFGLKGMQLVWELVRRAKGPSATSDLNRIWDGVGQWQK